jgi:hypothetical protein
LRSEKTAMRLDADDLRRSKVVKNLSRLFKTEALFVVAAVLLAGGLINYLLEGINVPAGTLLTRSLRTQSIVETLAYLLVAFMGVGGTFLVYRSGQTGKGIRESGLFFVSGVIILLISFFLVFSFWSFKTGA